MILGLQKAAEYMTARGRPTTWQGLQSLLTCGRHPGIGRRHLAGQRTRWEFREEELDQLIERVRPYRRKVAS